jgi:hypothetical protein
MINFAFVTGILQESAPQLFVDCVARQSALYNFLRERNQVRPPSSGQGPTWRAKLVGSAGAALFNENDPAPAGNPFQEQGATLPWQQFHATVSLGGLSRDTMAASSGLYIENYLAQQMEDAMMDIATQVNIAIQADLVAAISALGIYAGINRGVWANWQSYENTDIAPRNLTNAIMADVHDTLLDVRLGNYDAILTSTAQLTAAQALPQVHPIIIQAPSGQPGLIAQIGYMGGRFRDRPIYALPGYPAGRMDFVDTSKMWIEILKDVSVEKLAKVNDDDVWYITLKLRLVVSDPGKGAATALQLL